MLVLVLTLVSVSLETWALNLDLTIPSLETQSTSELDSKVKREIMMGWTCCWENQHISNVRQEHSLKLIELKLKEKPNPLQFTLSEEPSNLQWTTFITLQFADIYTTYRGLKYNCVKETNPLLGESPSVSEMFVVKTAILLPTIGNEKTNNTLTKQTLVDINFLMTMVVANNLHVIGKAKKYCN